MRGQTWWQIWDHSLEPIRPHWFSDRWDLFFQKDGGKKLWSKSWCQDSRALFKNRSKWRKDTAQKSNKRYQHQHFILRQPQASQSPWVNYIPLWLQSSGRYFRRDGGQRECICSHYCQKFEDEVWKRNAVINSQKNDHSSVSTMCIKRIRPQQSWTPDNRWWDLLLRVQKKYKGALEYHSFSLRQLSWTLSGQAQ